MPDKSTYHGSIGSVDRGSVGVYHGQYDPDKVDVTVTGKDGQQQTAALTYPEIYALIGILQGANMRLKEGCK